MMNRHPGLLSHALISGILILSTVTASVVSAQTNPSAGGAIPDAVKTTQPPNNAAIAAAVDGFVPAQVEALASTDAAARGAAREALVDGASARQGDVTPTYLAAYAKAVSDKIAPVLTNESDLVRLNAAIVVAKVAEKADDLSLRPAVLVLLKDKSPYVALWGIKGARAIIPAAIRNPLFKGDEAIGGIVKAVGAHAGSMGGPIVLEGYDALVFEVLNPNAALRPTDKMITAVIPPIQELLQQRVTTYRKGIPAEPFAEVKPTSFLSNGKVWALQTPQQRLTSMQLMSDLIGLAAQHAVAAAPGVNRDKLQTIIGHVASAMAVVPEVSSSAAVKDKLTPVTKINQSTPAAGITEAVSGVADALKTIKGFEKLTPPPAIAAAVAGAGGDAEIVEPTTQ
ncbi:MAG: hypothetical protein WBD40_01430, partial [Tepidisphaeraceae bacterium]